MNQQEKLWSEEFGNSYTYRNHGKEINNQQLFRYALPRDIKSFIEFGAGAGENITAIRKIYPGIEATAIEINKIACEELRRIDNITVHQISAFDYEIGKQYDVVLTKGFLIHIFPDDLKKMYRKIYESSNKFILLCEYYNPVPIMIEYRGMKDSLWKRDFAGDMLDMFDGLKLVDYGFVYHRDEFPQDDLHWFLLKKEKGYAIEKRNVKENIQQECKHGS